MKKQTLRKFLLGFLSLLPVSVSWAGTDLTGLVQQIQVAPNGNLYFSISDPRISTYCYPGWAGFTLYVPKDDPQFAYYYGLLMVALTKNKNILIANIDAARVPRAIA